MAFDGPPGSGKTLTALRFAMALAAHEAAKDGGREPRIALIDTEFGSASLYAGDKFDGVEIDFDSLELDTFSPMAYVAAIEEAGRLEFDVVIVDSLSHAWQGKDGALELVAKKGGNQFTAWKDVTPMHTRLVEALLRCPCHLIATMRTKVEYVLETNDKGKEVPRKVGTKPIQREGIEYEFDIVADLDISHVMTVSKSRCTAIDGAIAVKPGAEFMGAVIRWLDTGDAGEVKAARISTITDEMVERIVGKLAALGRDIEKEKKLLLRSYSVNEFGLLTPEQAGEYERRLDIALARAKTPAASQNAAASREESPTPASVPAAPVPPPPAVHEPPPVVETSSSTPAASPSPATANGKLSAAGTTYATQYQLTKLIEFKAEFFDIQGVSDPARIDAKWLEILGKRGVKVEKDLTTEQAQTLLESIHASLCKLHAAKGTQPPPAASPF